MQQLQNITFRKTECSDMQCVPCTVEDYHPISIISKSRYAFIHYIIIFLLVVLCHGENISLYIVVNISNSGEGIRLSENIWPSKEKECR